MYISGNGIKVVDTSTNILVAGSPNLSDITSSTIYPITAPTITI